MGGVIDVRLYAVPAVGEANVQAYDSSATAGRRCQRLAGCRVVRAAPIDLTPELGVGRRGQRCGIARDEAKVRRECLDEGPRADVVGAVVDLLACAGTGRSDLVAVLIYGWGPVPRLVLRWLTIR